MKFPAAFSNRNFIIASHDAAMAAASFPLAAYLRLWPDQMALLGSYFWLDIALFASISVAVFSLLQTYRGSWRYVSMHDLADITKAATLAVLVFAIALFAINRLEGMPRSLLFIQWIVLLGLLSGSRAVYRAMNGRTLSWREASPKTNKIPVLLIGAQDNAERFIRDMARNESAAYEAVGIIDNDPKQTGRTIHGVPIYGKIDALPAIIDALERKSRRPLKLILADEKASGAAVRHLLEAADNVGIPLARLPRASEFKASLDDAPDIQPIAVEDLLSRAQNVLDRDSMRRLVEGKTVLITGAGGTIGSELTRQIAAFKPKSLVLLENSECNLYQIEREIRGQFPFLIVTAMLGDVRNMQHLDAVFRLHKPQLVFHAAAIKHVPMAENNIEETVLTNVFGTCNVAECCRKHHTKAMVLISTDKAVNPANAMGASKRLAENFCQALGEAGGTCKFITVRFGNVLGSTGSVVPLFQEQLASGGPLTVTHPDMTRYFMTAREAGELVLQAAALGVSMEDKQGCVFVLDMGQPVRILDLALQMIRLAGLHPHEDIRISYIGLRPGEKLSEELFHAGEKATKTAHGNIFLAAARCGEIMVLRRELGYLFEACNKRDAKEALRRLKELVPEYTLENPAAEYERSVSIH